MQVTINSITRPTGCDHYTVNVTMGGTAKDFIIHKQDILDDPGSAFDAALQRLRSYCKENSLSTFSAIKTALEGKTFQL